MTESQRQSLVVIGGSFGALDALRVILPSLPSTLAIPVAIVLHMLPGKPSGLPAMLGHACLLPVKEADDKEPLQAANVYLAAPNYHLLLEKGRHFALSVDEPVLFSRPSIDVLFESGAAAYGPALVGVLLSGANEDGARGLACIKAAGGTTIVQTPATSLAPQMPASALRLSTADHVVAPADIGPLLIALASRGRST